MSPLEISLLGPFQVTKDGCPVTQFETAPTRALLIYLVMHTGTPFRREVLADLLWPEQPRSEALHALRQTLNRLRRAIKDQEATPTILHITRQTIQFNPDSDYGLDVNEFTGLTTTIHKHRHRTLEACNTCMQQLSRAADLYRGNLLSGFNLDSLPFQEWLIMEREHLHRQAIEIFYYLATCHNRRGEYKQAQRYARRQLKLEPWREEAHRQLMVALSLSDQRSAALAQYQLCRQTLSQELNIEPEAETNTLYEQIRDENLADKVLPPHNLPAPLTRFVGREAEMEQIADYLNDPDCRLPILVGPGGVGKTRLALAAAKQTVAYFPDGAWFIPLSNVRREGEKDLPNTLASAIGEAMGLVFSGPDSLETQLREILKAKKAILILDNFEHLTSGTDFILDILRDVPDIVVLVTSRTRLDTQAEQIVRIEGLPVPPQNDDPTAADYASVKLFLNRVSRALDNFSPDITQVVQLCRLVEGVPLAIELASAWVEKLPLPEITTNLRQDLDILSTTHRDIPPRQRCLRTVFESSWQLLSAVEQRTLAQLAIFQDGFSRAAALAVTEVQQADLVDLENKSLLHRTDPDRYTLHALVRQFIEEKLEAAPPLSEAHNCHSHYYLKFVSERTTTLQGDAPQQATTEILKEIANIRYAWQWAVDQISAELEATPRIKTLGQCVAGLAQFYTQAGLLREGEQVFRAAADRVQTLVQDQERQPLSVEELAMTLRVRSKLLATQGHFLVWLGDHSTAVTILQNADTTYEKAAVTLADDDLADQSMLLVNLGTSYNRMGDYALAVQHFKTGLALARQANAPQLETTALTTLAQAVCEQGDYDTAQQYLDEVLALAQDQGNRTSEASALSMLGSVAWRWGDFERAKGCIQESLSIYKELDDQHRIPRLLNVLGVIAIMQEEYAEAEQHYEEGLIMAQEMGDRQAVADMLNNLGYINHHHLNEFEKAKQYYEESLTIGKEIGHRQGVTSTLSNLGHLHVLSGEYGLAWERLGEALNESTEIGVTPLTLDALVSVAQLQTELEQYASAAELLELVLHHPAVEADSTQAAEPILSKLRKELSADQFEMAQEQGRKLELDAVVERLLIKGV